MSQPSEADLEQYAATAPREIAFNLRRLIKDVEPISVVFNDGNDSFLTVLLDVDEEDDLLYFDYGGAENINRKLLDSERAYFMCSPHGIRHQFPVGKVWRAEYQRRPAFVTHLPKRFIRLQRREFFRLELPLTQRLNLRVDAPSGAHLTLSVVDIGLGGIGAEIPGLGFDPVPGIWLRNGIIDLPQLGRLRNDLELRSARTVQHGTREVQRLGLKFAGLSRAEETLLQRYLNHMQQELNAKR